MEKIKEIENLLKLIKSIELAKDSFDKTYKFVKRINTHSINNSLNELTKEVYELLSKISKDDEDNDLIHLTLETESYSLKVFCNNDYFRGKHIQLVDWLNDELGTKIIRKSSKICRDCLEQIDHVLKEIMKSSLYFKIADENSYDFVNELDHLSISKWSVKKYKHLFDQYTYLLEDKTFETLEDF